MLLQAEIKFFNTNLAEWLPHHAGKFALIRGEESAGFFDTADAAYAEGIQRWGNVPFLIKQVLLQEPVEQLPALVYGTIHASI